MAGLEGVEGVEGISASAISARAKRGWRGYMLLDVVCPEPRYGMHVGVFLLCMQA